ncbi:hypothetical protein G8A07_15785 [Roseateles sp. DAIF2]|uniref:hypothetical protein n=1 Tax=Roseateles sp. DAIF2 TaxID=2714952 RepID=UPI0018A2EE97|nr:hypothetical protein [Roseateles sp. DAIF2]QPF74235.1 hypothetical protein G8A07_15785 [Roseateles sp. DAIF2]
MSGLAWHALPARARAPALDPRHDAFAGWAEATDFNDAQLPGRSGPPQALWLMLELREPAPDQLDPPCAWLHQRAAELPPNWLRLPDSYAQPLLGLESLRFCTALANPDFIRALGDAGRLASQPADLRERLLEIRAAIDRYEIALEGDWWEAATAWETLPRVPGDPLVPLVIGIIDDGLPFAHQRLSWRAADGSRHSRFLSLWNLAARGAPDPQWGSGEVLDQARLDQAIALASDAAGHVDEDAAYALLDMGRLLRHRATHGAHVADLACGMPPPAQAQHGPAIVGVQLRPMESTLCISAGAHLFDALRFVVERADRAGAERIVVNASLGNIAGPHNGSSMFEAAVDALIALRRRPGLTPVELVLPEGNSHLSRCHARARLEATKGMALQWRLRPDDGTSSYLETWLLPEQAGAIAMDWRLTPPGGPALDLSFTLPPSAATPAQEWALRDAEGRTLALFGLHPDPANGNHALGLLTVAPTAPYGPWTYAAPSGAWALDLRQHAGSAPLACSVYSQRDEKSFGHPGRGRQAVLEDKGCDQVYDELGWPRLQDRGDCLIRRAGSINALACGTQVEVVGGLTRQPDGSLAPAPYSSVGLPSDPRANLRKLAISEDSPVLRGIHAAGCRSGSVVALSGTSMAAPQHARRLGQSAAAKAAVPPLALDHNGVARSFVEPDAEQERRSALRRGKP